MYLVVSVPQTDNYVELQTLVANLMETKGFACLGVAFGLGTCEFEFQDDTPLGYDDDALVELETELRSYIQTPALKLFVED